MRPLLPVLLLSAVFAGCQQPAKNTAAADHNTDTAIAIPAGPQCFARISGRDTAFLRFSQNKDSLHGQLEYRLFEKDRNTGTLAGTVSNSIITASYQFMSEGVMSTRPVVFRLDGDRIYEGIAGELDNEGQPVFDKDPGKIRFDTIPYTKVSCP